MKNATLEAHVDGEQSFGNRLPEKVGSTDKIRTIKLQVISIFRKEGWRPIYKRNFIKVFIKLILDSVKYRYFGTESKYVVVVRLFLIRNTHIHNFNNTL